MTTSATRRFIDLIGRPHLERGSQVIDRGLVNCRTLEPVVNGKTAVITSLLYPRSLQYANPYLAGSLYDRAYRSGAAIERADLADVVGRLK